jgi:uncharacterized RDD family membrane protein YckC
MNETSGVAAPVARENLLGVRIVAGIIDLVVIIILGAIMTALFGDTSNDDDGFNFSLSGVPFIVYVLLSFSYYFFMENATGQTLGKMAMKLKVVSVDGPLTPGKVAVRTVLRIVDGFAFYLVGVVIIAISKNQQRLGDMAGGTTVVRAGAATSSSDIPRL